MNNNMFYIDKDSFYACVEEVNDQKKEALLICVNYDKKIILSANYLAGEKGTISGMSLFFAKEKYRKIKICKPNLEKYNLYSLKIEEILRFFSSSVVKQSVDE